jgi:anti-sigma B factor antagonist
VVGEQGLNVLVDVSDDRYVMRFDGHIDMATVGRFQDGLAHARADLHKQVLIDLSGVDFMDSTGLSALIDAEVSARLDRDRLRFLPQLQPAVEALLRVSGLYEEFDFAEPLD